MCASVRLYIYDISKGLAKLMAKSIIGVQLNGVWHTSVVVYGREYYFGSGGISSIEPGSCELGPPDTVEHMGITTVTKTELESELKRLGGNEFQGSRYDLFEHNCNNFSDRFCMFLVNRHIPSEIIDLPNSILATPQGSLFKMFLSNMNDGSATTQQQTVSGQNSSDEGMVPKNFLEPLPHELKHLISEEDDLSALFMYCHSSIDSLKPLSSDKLSMMEAICDGRCSMEYQTAVVELFRLVIWHSPDALVALMSDESKPLFRLLQRMELCEPIHKTCGLMEAMAKLWTNIIAQAKEWDLEGEMSLPWQQLVEFCTSTLETVGTRSHFLTLAFNIALCGNISEDLALSLGSLLLHLSSESKTFFGPDSYENFAATLYLLMKRDGTLIDLALAQEFKVTGTDALSARLRGLLNQ